MVSINMVTAFIEHTHVLLEIEREREVIADKLYRERK